MVNLFPCHGLFTDSHQMRPLLWRDEPCNSILKLGTLKYDTNILSLWVTQDRCGFWRLAQCCCGASVLVKCVSEMSMLDLTLLYFDTCRNYNVVESRPPPPPVSISSVSPWAKLYVWHFLHAWAEWYCALCVEALHKPPGRRGESRADSPRKRVIAWGRTLRQAAEGREGSGSFSSSFPAHVGLFFFFLFCIISQTPNNFLAHSAHFLFWNH